MKKIPKPDGPAKLKHTKNAVGDRAAVNFPDSVSVKMPLMRRGSASQTQNGANACQPLLRFDSNVHYNVPHVRRKRFHFFEMLHVPAKVGG